MVTTRLEEKLARIRKDPQGATDFLICDAKDGDMGGGIPMPGPRRDGEGRPTAAFKTRHDYLDQIAALVRQDSVDLVLLSISNLERLVDEGVFRDSRVATAIRANDTTDIWGARHGVYKARPSLPHRSALIEHAMHGRQGVAPGTPRDTFELLAAAQRGGARLIRIILRAAPPRAATKLAWSGRPDTVSGVPEFELKITKGRPGVSIAGRRSAASAGSYSRRTCMSRRHLLAAGAAIAGGLATSSTLAAEAARIGLTPVLLDSDMLLLRALDEYFRDRLDRPVELVRRRTYQEISMMLLSGQLDAAWICGFPYVQYRDQLALVAVPVYLGKPLYQSYVIVNGQSTAQHFADLRGQVHAFSDPDSNSGFLVTRALLAEMGETPDRFFRYHFFTYGHRNVIRAVAAGLAGCGSVDGYVYDVVRATEPDVVQNTRVIRRSEWLGFPPIACHQSVRGTALVEGIANAFLSMDRNKMGQEILGMLHLDGFAPGEPSLFDGIAAKYELVRRTA